MIKEYKKNQGIKIIFNDYYYKENGESRNFFTDYINSQEKAGIPLHEEIDPVLKIEEDDINFIVFNGSYSYKYLKAEIKSYSFYDMKKDEE